VTGVSEATSQRRRCKKGPPQAFPILFSGKIFIP
jgi:hypothetical protein